MLCQCRHVLCCVVLCRLVMCCVVLSCVVLSCLALSCLALSCRVLSCLACVVSCRVLFLSCRVLPVWRSCAPLRVSRGSPYRPGQLLPSELRAHEATIRQYDAEPAATGRQPVQHLTNGLPHTLSTVTVWHNPGSKLLSAQISAVNCYSICHYFDEKLHD